MYFSVGSLQVEKWRKTQSRTFFRIPAHVWPRRKMRCWKGTRHEFIVYKRIWKLSLNENIFFTPSVMQGAFLQTAPRCREDKEGHDILCRCVFTWQADNGPGFPDSSLSSDAANFLRVRATTILAHCSAFWQVSGDWQLCIWWCYSCTCTYKKWCGQGTRFLFRRLRSLCQWVSCGLCRVCEAQKLCFPVETCLRTRMAPRRLLLARQEPHICGETVFLAGSSPLRRRLKKVRAKEQFISSGDSISSSLQAGHQLASGGKLLIRQMFWIHHHVGSYRKVKTFTSLIARIQATRLPSGTLGKERFTRPSSSASKNATSICENYLSKLGKKSWECWQSVQHFLN